MYLLKLPRNSNPKFQLHGPFAHHDIHKLKHAQEHKLDKVPLIIHSNASRSCTRLQFRQLSPRNGERRRLRRNSVLFGLHDLRCHQYSSSTDVPDSMHNQRRLANQLRLLLPTFYNELDFVTIEVGLDLHMDSSFQSFSTIVRAAYFWFSPLL